MPVGGEPEAEPELGVVLEERVRPGRPAAVGVGRPRRGRQVAAVDRRAAGRVGDHQPVAEQLREQLEVRRLAAARAGAGELEQRLAGTGCRARCRSRPATGRSSGSVSKNAMFSRSAATSGSRGARLIALRTGSPGADDRAGLDAQRRSRCSPRRRPAACSGCRAGRRRRAAPTGTRPARRRRLGLVVVPGADHAVRADEAAVAALDAEVGVPDRDQLGDVALLVGRRAARVGAVDRQRADRQLVAAAGHHLGGDGADELRRVARAPAAAARASAVTPVGHLDPVQPLERAVDRGLVALDDLGAAPAVASSRSPP